MGSAPERQINGPQRPKQDRQLTAQIKTVCEPYPFLAGTHTNAEAGIGVLKQSLEQRTHKPLSNDANELMPAKHRRVFNASQLRREYWGYWHSC